ncbi:MULTISPECIES: hypothetical protein [unclassified Sinorhizobium]|uniref:hypothetical protein n=1 Tax=unclassified Sinorhizobium TaxID=2613772 RepID=UPI0024C3731B|nr:MULTISPECIES: hypothetical protein [unclassified Sinorhizobium]MDK1376830.1 hypothetical protein [Sinorhizobium sp. 6-70]MDK1481069.1 hypothetical protein [Sinorhizobium sp. 6-117]
MMQDEFHAQLREQFGVRVPSAAESIDIPANLEQVVADFFERLSVLDPNATLRVLRIWIDGKLRVAVDVGLAGLDDVIHDAEDAADKVLKGARFPLHPDSDWHEAMVARYGDAVPSVDQLGFRRGLQTIVTEMYEFLSLHGLLDAVDILGIETRSAAFVVIDARYKPGIYEDDRISLDFAFEKTQERLSECCEHCGRGGAIIAKAGLEARLAGPDVEFGDRLLCMECYESWRFHD